MFCPECGLQTQSSARPRQHLADYIRRFPATTAFLAINILVFLAMWLDHVSAVSPTVDQLIRWGANSGEKILFYRQWWRVVASAFVHIGAPHLIMNMWALWLMGTLAEAVLGTYLYAAVYLVCAIAGSLTSLYWNPLVVGAGASGALMGILGVLVSVLKFAHLPVPKEVVRSTTRSLVWGALLTLAIGILPRIDNAAHVGGLICGLLMGLLLSLTRRANFHLQRTLRWIGVLVPLALMVPLGLAAQRRGEPWIHYQWALDALRASRFPQAELQARTALAGLPNSTRVLELLSLTLYYEGNDAEAGKYLRELLARNPRNVVATNNLAAIELKEGDAAGARDLLAKALPLQPGNANGQVYLGRALQALNEDNQAIAHYRQAIAIDPNLYEGQMALGSIYEKHGQAKDAILFYRRAAQIEPRELEPLRGLARSYLAAGMKTQADEVIAVIQKREQAPAPQSGGTPRE